MAATTVLMRNSSERITSREGINAVQAFFDRNGCVFQEVAQQNDFGKDGYVDLGEDGVVSYLCAALQVKAGASYKSAGGDYRIPLNGHSETWRFSTVPVFGIVFDPDDRQLRWVDITEHLRQNPSKHEGSVPVPYDNVLDERSLRDEFHSALAEYSGNGLGSLTLNLLVPGPRQFDAVVDAWALGRFDSRYVLVLRRLILDLEGGALLRAIAWLSHAGLHPDIFWTKDNWIPEKIQQALRPSFAWSPEEIVHMLKAVDNEDWGRGTSGQCVDVLLYEDRKAVSKLELAIGMLLDEGEELVAARAAVLSLTHAGDQRNQLNRLATRFPLLLQGERFRNVAATVREVGFISMY
jgi:Domain of unknown function (DUF4365)